MAIDWNNGNQVLQYANSYLVHTTSIAYQPPLPRTKPKKQHGTNPMRAAIRMVRLYKDGCGIDPESRWLHDFKLPTVYYKNTDYAWRAYLFITRSRARDQHKHIPGQLADTLCTNCGQRTWNNFLAYRDGGRFGCLTCFPDHTERCELCNVFHLPREMFDVEGLDHQACRNCRRNYIFCEECQVYSRTRHRHAETNPCCSAPHPNFRIPSPNGDILPDTPITTNYPPPANMVATEAGHITRSGFERLQLAIYNYIDPNNGRRFFGPNHYDMDLLRYGIGSEATNSNGNWVKRWERALYKLDKTKPDNAIKATLGQLVEQHTAKSRDSTITVEFTRDFNQAPAMYANENSCWWTDYKNARCQLKQIGGIAMRQWDSKHTKVTGRAWLLPIKKAPTTPPVVLSKEHCGICGEQLLPGCHNCGVHIPTNRRSCTHCRTTLYRREFHFCPTCDCARNSAYDTAHLNGQLAKASHEPTHDTADVGWIVFNEYGTLVNVSAHILANILGLKFHAVVVPNRRPNSIGLYMNNATNQLVGPDAMMLDNTITLITNWKHQ